MPVDQIKTSETFRKSTFRASLAIVQFVIIYLLLICGAVLLTALCGLAGYALLYAKFTGITLGLAIGLVCIGFFVLFFLIKFIFKRHIVDRSALTEISEKEQPELFALIRTIVQEAQTDFPKKVYLSSEVNAAVFYDSGFWSMFLPIRKNLQIGMGLVNSTTVSEFKAVLAHEFGHFSQRSMKVGSYVYNVNQVIYNMLYDNSSFDAMLERWGNSNAYIKIASSLATWVIKGIQWVLKKAYNIVNLNYLSLSREMEFHADEVAAHVAGSSTLATALMRFELASYAYNAVTDYHYQQGLRSANFYAQHEFVMHFFGEKDKLRFENDLPMVESAQSRYNKSKLVITDQWASHPSVEDRVQRLTALNQPVRNEDSRRASELFRQLEHIQQTLSEKMFVGLNPESGKQINPEFEKGFIQNYQEWSFSKIYNGYYDNRNPVFPENHIDQVADTTAKELFSDEVMELIYRELGIETDIQTIEAINEGRYNIKSFDYDGNKYSADEAAFLLPNLRNELADIQEKVAQNDVAIYQFFTNMARQQQKESALETLITNIRQVEKINQDCYLIYTEMAQRTSFFSETTSFEKIPENIKELAETEKKFKVKLAGLQKNSLYLPKISTEMKESFEKYIHNTEPYFVHPNYNGDEVQLIFDTLNQYTMLVHQTHFAHKKQLLDFQAELFNAYQPANIAS